METLELRKQFKPFYEPSAKKVELVTLPPLNFLMLDGAIEPGSKPGTSPAFQEATEALFGVSYTLKFAVKKRKDSPVDYPVMPLEGLWWLTDGEFDPTRHDNMRWTLMIMQPEIITPEMVQAAITETSRKKGNPAVARVRFETIEEGTALQTLHIGTYATEPETLARMQAHAEEHGYRFTGRHHEIYLGDPRKTDPAKLKTVLRHPVQ